MNPRLTPRTLVQAAHTQNLLPDQADQILDAPTPSWPMIVASLIGAVLACLPVILLLVLISEDFWFKLPQVFVLSAVLLTAAVAGLRRGMQSMFLAQLCVIALISGFVLLCVGLFQLNDHQAGQWPLLILLIVTVGIALLVKTGWIVRVVGLGFASLLMALLPQHLFSDQIELAMMRYSYPLLINSVLLALLWALACLREPRWSAHPRLQSFSHQLHAFIEGVGFALLLAVLMHSGSLLEGRMHQGSTDDPTAGQQALFSFHWVVLLQIAITLACTWFLVRHWSLQREHRTASLLIAIIALALCIFAFFTRDGGVVILVATAAVLTRRWRMAALAVLVLLAQLSGFYYALAWPLTSKALLLAVVGCLLGLIIWLVHRQTRTSVSVTEKPALLTRSAWVTPLLIIGGVLALGAANWDVMGNERVIAQGEKIYVALAPRDPRSIMQGDYMALNFGFPRQIEQALEERGQTLNQRVLVVAELDEKGIAQVKRIATSDTMLASRERLLPLLLKGGNWTLVTDAFYFPEGQGTPFQAARFGEFRVLPDGRALLVGLVDEQLRAIKPSRIRANAASAEGN